MTLDPYTTIMYLKKLIYCGTANPFPGSLWCRGILVFVSILGAFGAGRFAPCIF